MKEIQRGIKQKPRRVVRIEVYKPEDMYYVSFQQLSNIYLMRLKKINIRKIELIRTVLSPRKKSKHKLFLFSSPITIVCKIFHLKCVPYVT
jgi:hypothetical protein